MTKCRNCGKETNSDYIAKLVGILCADCASKHIFEQEKELSDEMFRIKARLNELSNERNRLKQLDCDHEWIDTGYGRNFKDGRIEELHRCDKCNLVEYRPWSEVQL